MANQRKKVRKRTDDDGIVKILRFAAVPLIVILLIIIILYMDGKENGQEDSGAGSSLSAENGAALSGDSGSPDGRGETGADGSGGFPSDTPAGLAGENGEQVPAEGADEGAGEGADDGTEPSDPILTDNPSQYPFQQDAILELTGLVQAYCEAKEECDPELLAWVFGIEDWTEEQKNEEKAHMELVKASVKGYQNISCYSIQGPWTDSYVIFPYYEIRYRETEVLMPAFSWGYARKDESGRYYMVRETDDAVNEYIRKAGEKPEVKAVMAQILARQQEAIASDEVLQKIYGTAGDSEVIIGGVGG